MKTLVLATGNSGKINELQTLLAPIECLSQQQFHVSGIEETGLSFVENALLKARHASRISKLPALADDSGLVVQALNGKPGIYSARFAKEHASDKENILYLLEQLNDAPASKRQAFFYCALVLVSHADDPTPLIATGSLQGRISLQPHGKRGFGYDPVFYLPQKQCTLAELPLEEKNKISHRASALKQLMMMLEEQRDKI
jgi:XTP/dITP diphosphohydrolase